MPFICASFVLICTENFFVCAQLDQKLFKNKFSRSVGCWRNENSKWSDRAENSVNRLRFVCAAIFLVCATPLLKLGAKNPRILSEISKSCEWGENGLCSLFVLAGSDFFRLCSIKSKVIRKVPHFKVTHSIVQCVYPEMKIGFLQFARKFVFVQIAKNLFSPNDSGNHLNIIHGCYLYSGG